MNKPNDTEIERLANQLEETARLWREHGKRALDVTEGWEQGPRSPAMEPSFGWRYEDCWDRHCVECPNPASEDEHEWGHKHARPSDPTGEAAFVTEDQAQSRALLVAQVAHLDDAAHRVRKIVKTAVPAARLDTPSKVDESRDEVARAGWCVSCYRVDKRCEPIATTVNKRTGKTENVYAEFCGWCGRFVAEWRDILGVQGLPPIELVRLHHTHGKRVTEAKVLEAMAKVRGVGEDRVANRKRRTHDEIQADIDDRRTHRMAG